jgi:hypothetical protein
MNLVLKIEEQQRGTMHSNLIAELERIARDYHDLDDALAAVRAHVSSDWWLAGRGGSHVWLSFVGGVYKEPVRVAMLVDREASDAVVGKVTVEDVRTVSGSAGGSERRADVVLRVRGHAESVDDVRKFVFQAAAHHDALVDALRGLYAQVEKAFLVNHSGLCAEYRQENADACERALNVLQALQS